VTFAVPASRFTCARLTPGTPRSALSTAARQWPLLSACHRVTATGLARPLRPREALPPSHESHELSCSEEYGRRVRWPAHGRLPFALDLRHRATLLDLYGFHGARFRRIGTTRETWAFLGVHRMRLAIVSHLEHVRAYLHTQSTADAQVLVHGNLSHSTCAPSQDYTRTQDQCRDGRFPPLVVGVSRSCSWQPR
jgi:hypothetical protein